MPHQLRIAERVPLAPRTTLEVGGPARWLTSCRSLGDLEAALAWTRRQRCPLLVLGSGSNLLVADRGFPGLVVDLGLRGVSFGEPEEGTVLVEAAAGTSWDELVAETVARGLAGIECLSGIPGRVGAAPMQNIGAYGQELAQTVERIWTLDKESGQRRAFSAAECAFGYRTSRFKADSQSRWIITRVDLRLADHGRGQAAYGDMRRQLGLPETAPETHGTETPGTNDAARTVSVAEVREAVLTVRRSKSMVLSADDPNRRSAGSFFVNPVVPASVADQVEAWAEAPMPRFPAGTGSPGGGTDRLKLSAAWLLERSGFTKGYVDPDHPRVGLSSRHALALINRGGAQAADVVAVAARLRREVRRRFGVTLVPEPRWVGFERPMEEILG